MKHATVEQLTTQVERLQRQLGRARRGEREQAMPLSCGDVVGPGGAVGQFWTPPWLARAFVGWLGIRSGMRVLDGGSGMGALSYAAADVGARVTAVEIDPVLAERTRERLEARGVMLVEEDLLLGDRRQTWIGSLGAGYDIAISNPPWEGDLPARFAAAMLERSPRAGLIVPQAVLAGVERRTLWDVATPVAVEHLTRRPCFDELRSSGGGKRDVILLELRRGGCRGQDVMVRMGVGK